MKQINDQTKKIQAVICRLSKTNQQIDLQKPVCMTSDLKAYLHYYGFQLDGCDYFFGRLDAETSIMVQVFAPNAPCGTVLLLHGYLDHVGLLRGIIQFMINRNYRVISYDSLGHGLSEGKRASIQNFSDYANTLERLISKMTHEWSGPFFGIGHSTGSAVLVHYLLSRNRAFRLDRVVLVSPLIHSRFFYLSRIGAFLIRALPQVRMIRRHFYRNTSDERFHAFLINDPMQARAIPLGWIHSLIRWNREIARFAPKMHPVLIIQGTKDATLDWRYNLNFLNQKLPNSQIKLIDEGEHQLFNESKPIQFQVFEQIEHYLRNNER